MVMTLVGGWPLLMDRAKLAAVNGPHLQLGPLTAASHQPGHYHAVKTGSPHCYSLIKRPTRKAF